MKWIVPIMAIWALFGCQKESPPTWKVNYRVVAYSTGSFEYRVSYQTPSNATVLRGPLDQFLWVSDTLEFERGSTLKLDLEMVTSDSDCDLEIVVNGITHARKVKKMGRSNASLSYQL